MYEIAKSETRFTESLGELQASFSHFLFGPELFSTSDVGCEQLFDRSKTHVVFGMYESLTEPQYVENFMGTYQDLIRDVIWITPESRTTSEPKSRRGFEERVLYTAFEGIDFEILYETGIESEFEILLLMNEWGIRNQVNKTLEVIQETYSSLRGIELTTATDPEIPERKRIRVTLIVSGTPEKVFEDELRFMEWMCNELNAKAGELIAITYKWE